MDLAAFEDHLDRYGGSLDTWPRDKREAALAFMAASGPARAAYAAVSEFEHILSRSSRTQTTGVDAMAARAMSHRQPAPPRRFVREAGWAAAAAIVLFFGLAIGDIVPNDDDGPDHVISMAFDSSGAVDGD